MEKVIKRPLFSDGNIASERPFGWRRDVASERPFGGRHDVVHSVVHKRVPCQGLPKKVKWGTYY